MQRATKLNFYSLGCAIVLMYDSETLTVQQNDISKMQASQMKFLRADVKLYHTLRLIVTGWKVQYKKDWKFHLDGQTCVFLTSAKI